MGIWIIVLLLIHAPARKPGFVYLSCRGRGLNRGVVAVANADGDGGVKAAPWFRCFDGMPLEADYWKYLIVGILNGHVGELSCESARWITCRYGFKLDGERIIPAMSDDWEFSDFTGIEEDPYMFRRLNERMAEICVFFEDANYIQAPMSWTRLYSLDELPSIVSDDEGWATLPPDLKIAVAPNAKLTYSSATDSEKFVPFWGMGCLVQPVEASGKSDQYYLPEDFEEGKAYLSMWGDQAGAFGVVKDGYIRHYRHEETGYLANPELARFMVRESYELRGDVFKLVNWVHSSSWGCKAPGEFKLNEPGYTLRDLGIEAAM